MKTLLVEERMELLARVAKVFLDRLSMEEHGDDAMSLIVAISGERMASFHEGCDFLDTLNEYFPALDDVWIYIEIVEDSE